MEADILVEQVEETSTRSGNKRYVVRDAGGREYTTFRPAIGRQAAAYEGKDARIQFHEEDRKGFHNVYLDAIEPAPAKQAADASDVEPDEVAWSTAVAAAPWLVGSREPQEAVAADDFFERLEPFKRRVAEDIRQGAGERSDRPDEEPGQR